MVIACFKGMRILIWGSFVMLLYYHGIPRAHKPRQLAVLRLSSLSIVTLNVTVGETGKRSGTARGLTSPPYYFTISYNRESRESRVEKRNTCEVKYI